MDVPAWYEIGPENKLIPGSHDPLKDGLFDADNSILITVKSRETGNYFRYVFNIFDFRCTEDEDRATITLPFAFPCRYQGQVEFGITLTDDPFCVDAAGMGSLGYSFIKIMLVDAAFIVAENQTFVQGFVMHYRRLFTIPER